MTKNKAVVITGIGVISPLASGRKDFQDVLVAGKTGFSEISLFDTSAFNVKVAGEIRDFDPVQILGKKGLRSLDRSTLLVNSAARLALDDSGFNVTEENTHATGVSIGTTFGSLHSISQFDRVGLLEGPRYVNPSHFPNTVLNSPASQISIRFGIKGFNTTISTGFCASLDAVIYASDFIKLNRVKAVLAGGVEELCEETFLGFHTLGLLSGTDGSEPLCCPFDARRNGIILSEGAAILVLEDSDQAHKRDVPILAEIMGCGNAFDPEAERSFDHAGTGLRNAIHRALEDASLDYRDIDCIFSCANSSRGLDRMETSVINEVFGERAAEIPVTSIKSMIGESFSSSGSFALAAAVGSLQKGAIPPTVNYKERDPDCNLDYVPNESRKKQINAVLVTAVDPYGQNTAVIIGRNE